MSDVFRRDLPISITESVLPVMPDSVYLYSAFELFSEADLLTWTETLDLDWEEFVPMIEIAERKLERRRKLLGY